MTFISTSKVLNHYTVEAAWTYLSVRVLHTWDTCSCRVVLCGPSYGHDEKTGSRRLGHLADVFYVVQPLASEGFSGCFWHCSYKLFHRCRCPYTGTVRELILMRSHSHFNKVAHDFQPCKKLVQMEVITGCPRSLLTAAWPLKPCIAVHIATPSQHFIYQY